MGKISDTQKQELMQKVHVLCVTSIKEGWGLTVTEAGSQGTPSVVCNTDGLRDSVQNSITGYVARDSKPSSIAECVVKLLSNDLAYRKIAESAFSFAQSMTPERTYTDFKKCMYAFGIQCDTKSELDSATIQNEESIWPKVSIIIPTKNSERTIRACLESIQGETYKNTELIIVDNQSTDSTLSIAHEFTDLVFTAGPERSAQRNFGIEKATGECVLMIDSDMVLDRNIVEELVCRGQNNPPETLLVGIIPEKSVGVGFWAKTRALERSFYVGVEAIEAPRFFPRVLLQTVKGYGENLSGGEDWDLFQKIKARGVLIGKRVSVIRSKSMISHNEGKVTLPDAYKKKKYYGQAYRRYRKGSHNSSSISKQGVLARYWLFIKHFYQIFNHPFLYMGVFVLKTVEFAGALHGALLEYYKK